MLDNAIRNVCEILEGWLYNVLKVAFSFFFVCVHVAIKCVYLCVF